MPENLQQQSNTTTPQRVRRRGQRMTAEERKIAQEKFLKIFSKNANVRAACVVAGIDRSQVYRWQEHDTEFSLKFNIATEEANDLIRAALWMRGVEGVVKPVVSMGRVVYVKETGKDGKVEEKPLTERVYSDSLLSLLAKARMPEFRDKSQLDVNANVNARVTSANTITIDTRSLSTDQLAKLKAFALEMKGSEANG